MELLLYRHGETGGNAKKRYVGSTDEPLSSVGISALEVQDPSLETVYVTPLQRTKQTASILFPNAQQIVVEDLREMDFGVFENQNYLELSDNVQYANWLDSNCMDACPQGESIGIFQRRVATALSTLLEHATQQKKNQVVCVVHGGTIMAIASALAVPKQDYFSRMTENGECRRFQVTGEGTLVEIIKEQ